MVFDFMKTREFIIFINIMRVATFILLGVTLYYLISEIESVKLLGDACSVCMNKTGCTCFCGPQW